MIDGEEGRQVWHNLLKQASFPQALQDELCAAAARKRQQQTPCATSAHARQQITPCATSAHARSLPLQDEMCEHTSEAQMQKRTTSHTSCSNAQCFPQQQKSYIACATRSTQAAHAVAESQEVGSNSHHQRKLSNGSARSMFPTAPSAELEGPVPELKMVILEESGGGQDGCGIQISEQLASYLCF